VPSKSAPRHLLRRPNLLTLQRFRPRSCTSENIPQEKFAEFTLQDCLKSPGHAGIAVPESLPSRRQRVSSRSAVETKLWQTRSNARRRVPLRYDVLLDLS
jgi:hypothetical protein